VTRREPQGASGGCEYVAPRVGDRRAMGVAQFPGRPEMSVRAGAGRRGEERFALRHAELVGIAAGMFAERGYHATSIDDLVRATQLQRGGLYYYIGGKKELLLDIHKRALEPLLSATRSIAAQDPPPHIALRDITRVAMRTIDAAPDFVAVFLHEWRIIDTDPAWAEIRAGRTQYERIVQDVLERGAKEGSLAVKDVWIAMMAFLGLVNYAYRWFHPQGRVGADDAADYLCDIFLHGVTGPLGGDGAIRDAAIRAIGL
jgi:TetR/AcrR family transcriptional regulator, cholesterol catabolism regulator